MALTINQIATERKKVLRRIAQSIKDLDTKVEYLQRANKRLLNLRRKVPETSDLKVLVTHALTVEGSLNGVIESLKQAENVFGVI